MKNQYILFLVLNDIKKFKDVKKKLIAMNYKRFTVIDTCGSTEIFGELEFSSMLSSSMSETGSRKYNKTLFLVLSSEEEVECVMNELEKTINYDLTKPGKGIMFTVPIITCHGVRFEHPNVPQGNCLVK